MRILLTNLLIIFTLSWVSAQTSIQGGSVNGKWTKSGSPYIIKGSIQILNGDSLIVEPGVKVVFQNTNKLMVLGKLIAIGTPSDTIVFTAANASTGWRGIRFDGTPSTNDTSRISYCKIEYGNASGPLTPEKNGGGLYFDNFSKAVVSYSSIVNCKADITGGGIYILSSSPKIHNCFISGNDAIDRLAGGIYLENSNSIIFKNIITGNGNKLTPYKNDAGVECYSGNCILTENVIAKNYGYGIRIGYGSATVSKNFIFENMSGILCYNGIHLIINNVISHNKPYGGVYFSNTGALKISMANNIITNNISDNGAGIYCSGASPIFINNTIANNKATKSGGGLYTQESYPIFQNCIIWGNTAATSGSQVFMYDEKNDPDFYNCNIEGGSNAFEMNGNFFTGKYLNNINSDPLFVSPSITLGSNFKITANYWALQKSSPCIDKGDNTFNYTQFDIETNPRISNKIIDIGAHEFTNEPLPIADFNATNVCKNDSNQFVNNSFYGLTYLWDFGDGNYSNLKNPKHKYNFSGKSQSFKVSLLVTGYNSKTDFMEKIVNVYPVPFIDFTANDVCETKNVQFVSNSDKGLSYKWKFGDGNFSTLESPSHLYKISGVSTTFNVSYVGISKEGCSDSITKSVTVNANPNSDFTYSILGKQVDLIANKTNEPMYRWTLGNGDTLKATNYKSNYSYSKFSSGSYAMNVCLQVTNAAGCYSETCQKIIVSIADLNNFANDGEIKIYPNPSQGNFMIYQSVIKGSFMVEIINPIGQTVYEEELNQSEHSITLNLNNGIYIVKITNGEESFYNKLFFNK